MSKPTTSPGQIFETDLAQRARRIGMTAAGFLPETGCRQHHVIERWLGRAAPYRFAKHASLHLLEVDAFRISRSLAGTIKLPFTKLNSILYGRLAHQSIPSSKSAGETELNGLFISAFGKRKLHPYRNQQEAKTLPPRRGIFEIHSRKNRKD